MPAFNPSSLPGPWPMSGPVNAEIPDWKELPFKKGGKVRKYKFASKDRDIAEYTRLKEENQPIPWRLGGGTRVDSIFAQGGEILHIPMTAKRRYGLRKKAQGGSFRSDKTPWAMITLGNNP